MKPASRTGRALVMAVVVALMVAACPGSPRSSAPARPASVPAEAFWLGGPDGGVWLTLSTQPADSGRRAQARVFHQDGSVWYQGPLKLAPDTARAADLTDRALLAGWDGEALILTDGRAYTIARP